MVTRGGEEEVVRIVVEERGADQAVRKLRNVKTGLDGVGTSARRLALPLLGATALLGGLTRSLGGVVSGSGAASNALFRFQDQANRLGGNRLATLRDDALRKFDSLGLGTAAAGVAGVVGAALVGRALLNAATNRFARVIPRAAATPTATAPAVRGLRINAQGATSFRGFGINAQGASSSAYQNPAFGTTAQATRAGSGAGAVSGQRSLGPGITHGMGISNPRNFSRLVPGTTYEPRTRLQLEIGPDGVTRYAPRSTYISPQAQATTVKAQAVAVSQAARLGHGGMGFAGSGSGVVRPSPVRPGSLSGGAPLDGGRGGKGFGGGLFGLAAGFALQPVLQALGLPIKQSSEKGTVERFLSNLLSGGPLFTGDFGPAFDRSQPVPTRGNGQPIAQVTNVARPANSTQLVYNQNAPSIGFGDLERFLDEWLNRPDVQNQLNGR